MMENETEPVVVLLTTYKRLQHVTLTIDALKRNTIANDTILYISSDGPVDGDEEAVFAVRDYLKTVNGFRSVEFRFRDVNDRKGNWRLQRELLAQYGRVIYLEEDCVTSPYFLEYMRNALATYQDDPTIFAICGYCPPFDELSLPDAKSWLIPRFAAWGYGIWADRDVLVQDEIAPADYRAFYRDRGLVKLARTEAGLDLVAKFRYLAKRGMLAYDILANFQILQRGLSCVYPAVSLVSNIGHDGTGEHCGQTCRFEVRLANMLPSGELERSMSPRVLKRHSVFRSGGLYAHCRYFFRLLRGKYKLK